MNHAEGVFDRNELVTRSLQIALGAAQRRQNQSFMTRHEVAAVKLGADVHRQTTTGQGFFGARRIRCRRCEVAPERDKHFDFITQHGVERFNSIVACSTRGFEAKVLTQRVEERLSRFFINAHGAVTLNIAVTANRAQARPFFA